ncbi:hypothetical protein C923_03955 [Plasmodium falciparum UGT5.1]|nr:hypothetical protein C923_03955 [Plasmodium falciparum UGT5.1]
MKNYIDNIPIINSNDYVLVQTNLKNDLLLGYVKGIKYNLFFEILNMKKCFHSFLNENIVIYEINEDKEGYFKTIDGKKYLKEQIVYEKKDLLKNLDFYSMYYCDYYFSSNSIIELEKKNNNNINCVNNNINSVNNNINSVDNNINNVDNNINSVNNNNNISDKITHKFEYNDYNDIHLFFSFNICIKSVKNNLFLHIIYNDNNLKNGDEYLNETFPHYEELNLYNKQFDINKMDKNLFKSNTFFINNLYYHLKCKLLCVFKFINMSDDDFMTDIHISQIKKRRYVNEQDSYMLYTFNIHTLSNEGMVYIFFCNLYISNMFKENNFEIRVHTYLHFQLNKQNSYKKLKLIKYSSKFLYSLCFKEKSDSKKKKKKNDHHERDSDNNNNDSNNNNYYNSNNNSNYCGSNNIIYGHDENFIFNSCDFNTLDQIKSGNYLIKDETINENFIFEVRNYKYTFILISSKCNIIIITLRKKKRKEEYNKKMSKYSSCSLNENVYMEGVEILNYCSSNNKNTNNIICNTIINKYNYEINNNIKNKNKSYILFEIVCFYENGEIQKYIYTCSLKNGNFEFFLNVKEDEKTKSINCKKCFFKPILFPFNEELLNKTKSSNDLVLYNIKLSHFKNLIYIYFQEKKIEGISLTINNECLIINYIKMVSKLLKKILQNLYNSDDIDIVYNFQHNTKNKCNYLSQNVNIPSDNTISNVIKKNEMDNNDIKYNLFTQREVKSSFFEFKYILFGFYDLFLMNQKNYTDLNEKKKEEYKKKNFINCFDSHSHYNFLNIIKEYINYDYIIDKCSYNISNDTQKKKKIKLNFYYFLLIIQYFKNTYTQEKKRSFFYMVYNELLQRDKYLKHFYYTYHEIDRKTNMHLNHNDNNIDTKEAKKNEETELILKNVNFYDNYELINIRKYDVILFCFLFHMYNFCLKQNGLSNDEFNSHITYFLINKKMKKYKKKYRYISKKKIDTNEKNDDNNNINVCDSKNYKGTKNFDDTTNNILNKQNESLDNLKKNMYLSKNNYDNQLSSYKNTKQNKTNINEKYNNNNIIMNYLTWKKCLYYIYKIKKYTRKIETHEGLYISSMLYINIYLCQIFFILLNILRINNTNIYTNIHFDIRKNNLDYFYLLILLNFYSLFYILISDQKYILHEEENDTYISKNIDNKEQMANDKNIISLLSFFNNIYEQNKEGMLKNDQNKNNHNTKTDILYMSSSGMNISINTPFLEKYLILIYNIIKDKINIVKEDNYIMEKLFFKINCMICNKVCVTNIYNNYYICENNHIFNKCMLTFGCIYKNHIILPTIYLLHDINDKLFPINNDHILSYNLQYELDYIYFCSFCYNFITTQNSFYKKFFLFNQCPFCNHELNIL